MHRLDDDYEKRNASELTKEVDDKKQFLSQVENEVLQEIQNQEEEELVLFLDSNESGFSKASDVVVTESMHVTAMNSGENSICEQQQPVSVDPSHQKAISFPSLSFSGSTRRRFLFSQSPLTFH